MPHLRLKLLEGKTESQKQQLAQELVNTMQKVIGFGEESYSVAIEDRLQKSVARCMAKCLMF